jgi:hypothetical protein
MTHHMAKTNLDNLVQHFLNEYAKIKPPFRPFYTSGDKPQAVH